MTNQQAVIDELVVSERAAHAQLMWDSKRSANAGKEAFSKIKEALVSMCVSTELCNYCEHNEATDVEHIYPKSFFPERTFQWSNYLLACKQCNTEYKLDKFYVFTHAQSANSIQLKRKELPLSTDAAFIDPRLEDPMRYLFLDIKERTFHFIPHPELTDPRDIAKAERTLTVLQIGKRSALTYAREAALIFYQQQLDQYRKVQAAASWEDLEELVRDPHILTVSNGFIIERQLMLDNIKRSILEHQHPTVWREMQRQHLSLNNARKLFTAVPEALGWI